MEDRSRHRSTGIATVAAGVLRALSICTPAALLDAAASLAQAAEQPSALSASIPLDFIQFTLLYPLHLGR